MKRFQISGVHIYNHQTYNNKELPKGLPNAKSTTATNTKNARTLAT